MLPLFVLHLTCLQLLCCAHGTWVYGRAYQQHACSLDYSHICKWKVDWFLLAGAVLQCLRSHRASLTAECRKEELKLNIIQSQDVRLQPTLHKQCSEETAVFCPNVEPGQDADLPRYTTVIVCSNCQSRMY